MYLLKFVNVYLRTMVTKYNQIQAWKHVRFIKQMGIFSKKIMYTI